jgi:formate transporter
LLDKLPGIRTKAQRMEDTRTASAEGSDSNVADTTHGKRAERPDPVETAVEGSLGKRGSLVRAFSNRSSLAAKPTKTPKDTIKAVYQAGIYKAGLSMNVLCVQSFMAGVYIAMAGHMFLALGGGVLGSIFFPAGLIAVALTSGELFTGDSLVFVVSVLGRKVSFWKLLRNWTVSWIFNFAGCLAWAYVLGYSSGALEDSGRREFAIQVALKKAHQPWIHIFLKGIGANLLVCLGVFQGTAAEEVAGKILGLWFPVSGFVIMGFDHCIANQFLISQGMLFGADISITHFLFKALLPATLGNIVGGGVCVGAVYWYVFDSLGTPMHIFSRIRWYPITRQSSRYSGEEASSHAKDTSHREDVEQGSKRV